MKLIIDIPKDVKAVIDRNGTNEIVSETLWQATKNGTPLDDLRAELGRCKTWHERGDMTREEAIKELQESHDIMRSYDIDESESRLMAALDMAIKALEQEPCDDAISRHKAIVMITAYEGKSAQIEALKQLSSVNPQEPSAILDIIERYRLRIPPTVYDELVADIREEG